MDKYFNAALGLMLLVLALVYTSTLWIKIVGIAAALFVLGLSLKAFGTKRGG